MIKRVPAPIGIFDSGVGGLTVAAAIKKLLPDQPIIYFGDTAHLPYGDKSPESILHYSKKISDFLVQEGCKTVLAACNTVSATVWEELQGYIAERALAVNVIDPVAEMVCREFPGSVIGVIGTKNTIKSEAYPRMIKTCIPGAEVLSLPTPLLVPMIEEGFVDDDISDAIIRAYLSNNKLSGIEILILGCTHYPIISNQISRYFNHKLEVIDSAMVVAKKLKETLEPVPLSGSNALKLTDRFYISDHTEYFGVVARRFFNKNITLERIDLWK